MGGAKRASALRASTPTQVTDSFVTPTDFPAERCMASNGGCLTGSSSLSVASSSQWRMRVKLAEDYLPCHVSGREEVFVGGVSKRCFWLTRMLEIWDKAPAALRK